MSTGSSVEVAPSSTIAVLQDKSKDCPTDGPFLVELSKSSYHLLNASRILNGISSFSYHIYGDQVI